VLVGVTLAGHAILGHKTSQKRAVFHTPSATATVQPKSNTGAPSPTKQPDATSSQPEAAASSSPASSLPSSSDNQPVKKGQALDQNPQVAPTPDTSPAPDFHIAFGEPSYSYEPHQEFNHWVQRIDVPVTLNVDSGYNNIAPYVNMIVSPPCMWYTFDDWIIRVSPGSTTHFTCLINLDKPDGDYEFTLEATNNVVTKRITTTIVVNQKAGSFY